MEKKFKKTVIVMPAYNAALERGADAVVMIHPDYQYDCRVIPHALGFLSTGICDIVTGSRIRTRLETLLCGMPPFKYIGNRPALLPRYLPPHTGLPS